MIERIPPHHDEGEAAVLGCSLVDAECAALAVERLTPADFYRAHHAAIFAAVVALVRRGQPADIIAVRQQMGDAAPDYGEMLDLTGGYLPFAGLAHHIEEVKQAAVRRELIRRLNSSLEDAYDREVEDPLAATQARLAGLEAGQGGADFAHLADVASDVVDQAEARRRGRLTGQPWEPAVTFGLADLDERLLVGEEDMVVVGARPSAGKTAFGLQVALHVGKTKPVCFFSLEMSLRQVTQRALSQLTGISTRRQEEGDVEEWEMRELSKASQLLADRHIRLDGRSGLSVAQMHAAALRHKRKHGLGLVVVDHLSRVGMGQARSRYEGMTGISGDLAKMRRDLGVPLLCLAQLKRPEGDDEKAPTMADLRDSGAVEQDADGILLLHRPHRNGARTAATVLVPKWRMGEAGMSVSLDYDGPHTRFETAKRMGAL